LIPSFERKLDRRQIMQSEASLAEMRRLVCGFSVSIAVSAVADLGIADYLSDGPKTASDLARLSGADQHFLRRVLRYLASEGVFAEQDGGLFALTERSRWLRSDVPGSLRPRAVFTGSAMSWSAWGSLLESLKTGASGIQVALGQSLFEYVKSHPEAAERFNTFMAEQTTASVEALLAAYRFDGVRELVDVGGGRGALIAGVLRAYPGLRGILFDQPEVVATARPLLDRAGVADRCEVVGGDFFKVLPAGGDVYALKFILHDWPDQECIRILKNCRQAMTTGGRVLVVEHVVPEDSGPHFSKFMDMAMLVLSPGGRERTQQEFTELLTAAGLQLRRLVPTAVDLCALECVPSS
jgi:predicted O-methyltransferase YrrM